MLAEGTRHYRQFRSKLGLPNWSTRCASQDNATVNSRYYARWPTATVRFAHPPSRVRGLLYRTSKNPDRRCGIRSGLCHGETATVWKMSRSNVEHPPKEVHFQFEPV